MRLNFVYKSLILYICCLIFGILWLSSVYGQWKPEDTFPGVDNDSILTKWALYGEDVVSDKVEAGIWWWWADIAGWVEGIYVDGVIDNATAREKATNLMKSFLNYILWLLALVALIYLIYHGFLALTAGNDDEQRNKWISWIKYAAIAIIWLWASWFIVSLILTVIFAVADGAL